MTREKNKWQRRAYTAKGEKDVCEQRMAALEAKHVEGTSHEE